jgi:hypothetical protein
MTTLQTEIIGAIFLAAIPFGVWLAWRWDRRRAV